MAGDRDKIQEEATLSRLYKIILGWDYFQILKEVNVLTLTLSLSLACLLVFDCAKIDILILIATR